MKFLKTLVFLGSSLAFLATSTPDVAFNTSEDTKTKEEATETHSEYIETPIIIESVLMIEVEKPEEEVVLIKGEVRKKKQKYTVLTRKLGRVQGPTEEETYYNLPMQGVVKIMRGKGYTEEEYPYWEREDGVKMFGEYVMVAADFSDHKRGEIVETTLGKGMVCDTGTNIKGVLDIAVTW